MALPQPVFSGFDISARHCLAELGLETRELDLQQPRQSVMLQVRQRCFDLLMAERALMVAESSHAALAIHEADVRKFHKNGLVPLKCSTSTATLTVLRVPVLKRGADMEQPRPGWHGPWDNRSRMTDKSLPEVIES